LNFHEVSHTSLEKIDELEHAILDNEERENLPEIEENIAKNSQQAQNLDHSAIDYVAMDQEAAKEQGMFVMYLLCIHL